MNLEEFKESVNLYLVHKILPGSFVRSVLGNDLSGSFMYADTESRENLFEFVKYIFNEVPGGAWGSYKIVQDYLESKEV